MKIAAAVGYRQPDVGITKVGGKPADASAAEVNHRPEKAECN
jgi:hypothetical protein